MRTLADQLRDVLATQPFLEEALARGIINLSALARELRPPLEDALDRDLSDATVMMGLRRIQPELRARTGGLPGFRRHPGDLAVRSELVEFTFRTSPETLRCQQSLLRRARDFGNDFMTFTQGMLETTIIVSAQRSPMVEQAFAGEVRLVRLDDLAAVVVRLSAETVHQPGVHYNLLKQLAWNGLNVVEVVSTWTELTIVFARADIDRAFSVLMAYLSPMRERP